MKERARKRERESKYEGIKTGRTVKGGLIGKEKCVSSEKRKIESAKKNWKKINKKSKS